VGVEVAMIGIVLSVTWMLDDMFEGQDMKLAAVDRKSVMDVAMRIFLRPSTWAQ
jgi:hypothetical protein